VPEARDEPLIERLAVIGVGLIGSSILQAARAANAARVLVATDLSEKVRKRVIELQIADEVATDAATAVKVADLVIVCVPVGQMDAAAGAFAGSLKKGAIVSDVGSVKSAIVAAMQPKLPPHAHLIPAHPVAGTEHSGPDAGFAELFDNRWCIVTPPADADKAAAEKVIAFWHALGSNVEIMDPQHHDLVLAITSHLPHLIAYNIVGTASDLEEFLRAEVIKFSAGGFRDFTRIAASDPTMWRDVFLHNKDAVLEMLGRFNEDLASLAKAIRGGKGEELFELFTRTRAVRRSIIEIGQETAEPDFGRRRKKNEPVVPLARPYASD